MRSNTIILALVGFTSAAPLWTLQRREVPQEHSHEKFLTTTRQFLQMNNPAGISDVVFGLLGDAAASGGKGNIGDVSCLQTATADQAFSNAKAAGDVNGQVSALVYRALERNTQGIGTPSKPCTSIQPVNPQIAALSQHQDPASPGAADINKKIALELAKQIAAVGGDPTIAIQSGTFAPGSPSDLTGKGNTCDDQGDAEGCIFTQGKLVPDITEDEARAAAGGATGAQNGGQGAQNGGQGAQNGGQAAGTCTS
ncbi:MAG: hypothetical protein M1825_002106 [Sarcosagium campestre]|nr:MAG: hypothetical protein M1825_002106 [Sarcosagium campestre]